MSTAPGSGSSQLNPGNAQLAWEITKANFDEITAINKRWGDRIILTLGATATAFGLVLRVSDGRPEGVGLAFLFASLISLFACFLLALRGLLPRTGKQPGRADVDWIWANYVAVPPSTAYAHAISDLCDVTKARRKASEKMGSYYRRVAFFSVVTLVCAALSEAWSVRSHAPVTPHAPSCVSHVSGPSS